MLHTCSLLCRASHLLSYKPFSTHQYMHQYHMYISTIYTLGINYNQIILRINARAVISAPLRGRHKTIHAYRELQWLFFLVYASCGGFTNGVSYCLASSSRSGGEHIRKFRWPLISSKLFHQQLPELAPRSCSRHSSSSVWSLGVLEGGEG